MNCIIEGIDFYQLEAMKYYSPSTRWSAEKKKENAMQKIFSGEWWGAQKRDGIFCMCGRNQDGDIFLRPRAKNTKGEFVNKVDWVPQIHTLLAAMDPGTVFLGELYLPRDEQAKSTSSIMNSLQPRAVKKQQKEEDKLHLYIFDVLANKGKSLLDVPALKRFTTLHKMSFLHADYVEWAKYCNGQDLWNMLQQLLADGYEGVVITHQDAPYQPGKRSNKISLKIKKELQETIDCIIIGANAPTKISGTNMPQDWEYWLDEMHDKKILASDYQKEFHRHPYEDYYDGDPIYPVTKNWFYGWAGSLKLGLYDGDKLIHVGDLSGIDESIKAHWKDYVGTIAEINCMEIHDTGGLRHPRFLGWRMDKSPKDCTIEQIR